MRIWIVLLIMCMFGVASAQTGHKRKKVSRPRPAPEAPAQALPARETALRKLGVSVAVGKGFTPAQADALSRQFANDMTAMSYSQVVPIAGVGATALKAAADQGLDGIVLTEVTITHISGTIVSLSGARLATFSFDRDVYLDNDAQVKAVSRKMVDEAARAIPYRGFITRALPGGRFEVNLGQSQGLMKGQRFRVFDFVGPSFASDHRDDGEVVVDEVGESSAVVESTGSKTIRPFDKIGFYEQAHGMDLPQLVQTRAYAYLGGGLLNISGAGDPAYVAQAYNISSTPAFLLGGGWGKVDLSVLFAQAHGDQTSLLYIEGIGNYQLYERPFGGLNKFSVWVGGRVASVSISVQRGMVSPLASTTSISPEGVARLDRLIKGPVSAFIAASAYYPIFVTGMDTSTLLFSYGVGGDAGLSLDLSQRLFFNVGGRYHLIRRPVQGQTAVQETYTELFADLGYRF